MIKVATRCPWCKEFHYVLVESKDFDLWQGGAKVQDAFPYLSLDDREMLISGICPKCWDEAFSE